MKLKTSICLKIFLSLFNNYNPKAIGKMDIKEALDQLKKDEIKNISVTGFIENNPVKSIKKAGCSLLIKGASDHEWNYISSDNKSEFTMLISELQAEDKYFASLEDWMLPILLNNKDAEWKLTTMRLYLPKNKLIRKSKIATKKLNLFDSKTIIENSNYKSILSTEYLEDRISKSYSAGVHANGALIGWGLTHDDGALGSLHVMNDYRKKGYARAILISLINQCRADEKIPFVQVEEKNTPALNLVKSLGFAEDRKVTWIKLK